MLEKQAQTVTEYMLIFVIISLGLFTIASHFNLKSIKNMVFSRPADASGTSITIEAMTGGK